jgi:predicted Holliday junction resolvase-like endonuclease
MHLDLGHPFFAFLSGALLAAIVTAIALFRRASVIRATALDQSRAVIRGQVSEHLAPLVPEFPWEASDARFLGAPIDYVVFDGLSQGEDEVEIIFLEVKSGGARLSKREARVREAIEAGRVRFEVLRFDG